jgi:hypothetical protein
MKATGTVVKTRKKGSTDYLAIIVLLLLVATLLVLLFFFPPGSYLPYLQSLSTSLLLGILSLILILPLTIAGAYALGTFRVSLRDAFLRIFRALTMLPSLFWLGSYSLLAFSFRPIVPDFLLGNSVFLVGLLLVIKSLPYTIRSLHELWNVRGAKTLLSLQSLGLNRIESYWILIKEVKYSEAFRLFSFSISLILSDAVLFYLIGAGVVGWAWNPFEPSQDLPSQMLIGLFTDFESQKVLTLVFALIFWWFIQRIGKNQFAQEFYA